MKKLAAVLLLVLCATTTAQADELHMVYLPIVIDDVPNLGAHVWSPRHMDAYIPGSIAYVPVYPEGIVTYHEQVIPLLMGERIILGFRNWTGYPECAPPPPDEYDDWALWVATVTEGYLDNGHNIIAVEVWNEPEPLPEQIGEGMYHFAGCWGNTVQSGAQYSLLVEATYRAVKSIDERVQVIGGALMFYTLPDLPDFWLGAVEAGVNDNLDGVSYHNYSGYPANNWDTVFQKAEALRTTTTLPLWITETSLLCDQNCDQQFEQDQAGYFNYIADNATDYSVDTIVWFMSGYNNWRNTDLVRYDYSRKPVWYEFEKFFSWR